MDRVKDDGADYDNDNDERRRKEGRRRLESSIRRMEMNGFEEAVVKKIWCVAKQEKCWIK